MDSPPQTVTVRGGDFCIGKVAESYVGYGVVGKKQSGLGKKGWIGERTRMMI